MAAMAVRTAAGVLCPLHLTSPYQDTDHKLLPSSFCPGNKRTGILCHRRLLLLRSPGRHLQAASHGTERTPVVSEPEDHNPPPVGRIKKPLQKIELSVSSYDTAWVAMVPSSISAKNPQFPQCIEWILENQHPDGSWGPPYHPYLMKDFLFSTLACVIALKRWNLGEEHMEKGIHFVLSNLSFICDEKQHSPTGFNIIFPRMIEFAKDLGLHLPMSHTDIDVMLHNREVELERATRSSSKGAEAYLAYVAEGLDRFPEWEMLRKYQRTNGSIFDSPSTTAALLTHHWDVKCLEYLSLLVQKFENAVPTRYPLDILARLRMVDCLEGLGIAQHFRNEINSILDEVYRQWLQGNEEINSSIATCAMAFRLLRMHGYKISSGFLTQMDEDFFYSSLEGHLDDINTVLELYKSSQLKFPTEWFLDKLNFWTSNFLAEKMSNIRMGESLEEVDYALKFPSFANLERLDHRRNIKHFSIDNFQTLKTTYMLCNIDGKNILDLAVEEFNKCQFIYRNELEHLQRWIEENRLDQLNFARQKLLYCYFSAAATLFSSEMSDARVSWAKNGVLATLVDDFFDVGGSKEELINLIQLVEQWDENYATDCLSEQVKILYSAVHSTINELGAKASIVQKRNVTSHITEIWLDLLQSMMRETEWMQKKILPTLEEYLANGYVSFALGPLILTALYFVAPELCPDIIKDPEYHKLFKLVSTCGRLLNDIQTFEVPKSK